MAAILVLPIPAEPLNPAHELGQYGHTAWTVREGRLPAYPRVIAQATDGYLWLGTGFGLFRFDGIRFVSFSSATGQHLPSTIVTALVATPDGALWIGTTAGLVRLKDGLLTAYPDLAGRSVATLLRARDGAVWAGTMTTSGHALLCLAESTTVRCHGDDGQLGRYVLSLADAEDGDIWVGASNGLWRWSEQRRPQRYPLPNPPQEVHSIVVGDGPSLLLSLNRELMQFSDGRFRRLAQEGLDDVKPTALLRDRDDALWIGTQEHGLLRVRQGRVERFGRADGLSANFVVSLFEDREGNIWVGTVGGIDRLRDVAGARVATRPARENDPAMSVFANRDELWVTTVRGLYRSTGGELLDLRAPMAKGNEGAGALLIDGREQLWVSSRSGLTVLDSRTRPLKALRSIPAGYVHAMAEDVAGTVWFSDQTSGLVSIDRRGTIERRPWTIFDGREARALASDTRGGLWLGFVQGGLAYWNHGRLERSVGVADGLTGALNSLRFTPDGLWAATREGLNFVRRDRVVTMRANSGLPCDAVHWAIEDTNRTLWLHTECGLVQIRREAVERWLATPDAPIALTTFDVPDGVLRYSDLGGYGPKVARTTDGRIWFATYGGVVVLDPRRLPQNPVLPPVHIETVTGDGRPYAATDGQTLPPLLRDLWIEYTALSLVAPEAIHFRYQLIGRDQDWVDAGGRRQAFYTDLQPGRYTFRVAAANNRGQWNDVGATWRFSIAPAFHQTQSFRIAIVALALLGLYGAYRLRFNIVTARLKLRFDDRLAERTRIAQDLHDTLLQGLIAGSMQLHLVASEVTDQDLRSKLERVMTRISAVIEECRNAVVGLRASTASDLESAFLGDCESLRHDQSVAVHEIVNGTPRRLRPAIRDTIYLIGREALANAFRHANASRVEIQFEYDNHALDLFIRDDGRGIDQTVIEQGPSGHWGLRDMRDRADAIGATLSVLSRLNAGTEIKLSVPARIAFEAPASKGWRRWLSRW